MYSDLKQVVRNLIARQHDPKFEDMLEIALMMAWRDGKGEVPAPVFSEPQALRLVERQEKARHSSDSDAGLGSLVDGLAVIAAIGGDSSGGGSDFGGGGDFSGGGASSDW